MHNIKYEICPWWHDGGLTCTEFCTTLDLHPIPSSTKKLHLCGYPSSKVFSKNENEKIWDKCHDFSHEKNVVIHKSRGLRKAFNKCGGIPLLVKSPKSRRFKNRVCVNWYCSYLNIFKIYMHVKTFNTKTNLWQQFQTWDRLIRHVEGLN